MTLTLSTDSAATDASGVNSPCAHLVLLWARHEPTRVGESAAVKRTLMLGRGLERAHGDPPYLELVRSRPGRNEPTGAMTSPTLSRRQWRLAPSNGAIDVENLGRRSLFHNGTIVRSCRARAGDTLGIEGVALFLVVRRLQLLPPVDHEAFEFGWDDADGIVGETQEVWALRRELRQVAQSSSHTLVLGPSGTGKELCVRAIHARSSRADKPLVARNAASIPASIVEAELFGQAPNYPNAGTPVRQGLIGVADGGTLFLDELGELGEQQQANLLRVLDAGEYQRLGEDRLRVSDLRVLAATNRPVGSVKPDVQARFHERVLVPSLDSRRADIPLLLRHIMRNLIPHTGQASAPSMNLVDALVRHNYALNFRELERLVRLCARTSPDSSLILTDEVCEELNSKPSESQVDAEQIKMALDTSKNASEAAKKLGLSNRFALYRLMKQLGIATA